MSDHFKIALCPLFLVALWTAMAYDLGKKVVGSRTRKAEAALADAAQQLEWARGFWVGMNVPGVPSEPIEHVAVLRERMQIWTRSGRLFSCDGSGCKEVR